MKGFVGIGFGPIQSGLFVYEAFRSGNFDRLTVAEVDESVVRAVRGSGGCYTVNVASSSGISAHTVEGIRMLNPNDPVDRMELVAAISAADEIATALPSVDFYGRLDYLAEGLERRAPEHPAVAYTSENNTHAAQLLSEAMNVSGVQFLDTVIGKMSGVITEAKEQDRLGLAPRTPGGDRAVLVEEFNRILVSRITIPGFKRGIEVFEEKADLLPFEEAKLYGHNAIHALLGFLAMERGCTTMAEIAMHPDILQVGREAFYGEAGAGLLHRHRGVDPLFTPDGFRAYADDLLERMVNPFLSDKVERVVRDPARKLGWNDRLVGAMRITLETGINPRRLATGARLAVEQLSHEERNNLWPNGVWRRSDARIIAAMVGIAGEQKIVSVNEQVYLGRAPIGRPPKYRVNEGV